ncbi:MAG: Dabb family protein [Oscillospiraceae bacterium]
MIRHIVLWNLQENAEGQSKEQNAAVIREGLENLVGKIDGLLKAEVRLNQNPNGMDLCLYSEFTDDAALADYQNHPLHLKVKEFVHKVVTDRAVSDCRI